MAEITLAEAKTLCTAGELELVQASLGKALKSADEATLKKQVRLARKQFDKWRGQSKTQRRETQRQQAARVTDKNQRSERKAQLFGEVLARLESQLEKVSAAATDGRPAAQSKTTKSRRTQQHREARARVREELQEEVDARAVESASRPKPVKKAVNKPVKKKAAAPAAARSAKKVTKKTARKKASKPPIGTEAEKAGLKYTPKQSLKAEAAAKRARVKASGLTTRIRGHVSARGKRAQGRRDQ